MIVAAILAYLALGFLSVRLGRRHIHRWNKNEWPILYEEEGVGSGQALFLVVIWPIWVLLALARWAVDGDPKP